MKKFLARLICKSKQSMCQTYGGHSPVIELRRSITGISKFKCTSCGKLLVGDTVSRFNPYLPWTNDWEKMANKNKWAVLEKEE